MMKDDDQEQAMPRRARWNRLSLLLLGFIVVAGVLVWQVASHTGSVSTGGGSGTAGTSPPAAVSSSPLTPPVSLTVMYDEMVKEQVAQGLHLTVAQVTAQLQAQPTPDLRSVGKQQGLAQDQLYRLVLSALQTADDHMVSSDVWTQQQADEEMLYWRQLDQVALMDGVARWFLQH